MILGNRLMSTVLFSLFLQYHCALWHFSIPLTVIQSFIMSQYVQTAGWVLVWLNIYVCSCDNGRTKSYHSNIYMSCWASDSLKTRSTSFIYCEKKRRDLQWMFNQLSWVEITYKQSERFKGIHILYPDCTFTLTREVVKAWLSQHLQQGSEAANIRW